MKHEASKKSNRTVHLFLTGDFQQLFFRHFTGAAEDCAEILAILRVLLLIL